MEPKQPCNKHVKLSLVTNAAQLAQAINVLRRMQVKTIALEDSSTPRQSTFFFRYLSSSFKNIGPFPRPVLSMLLKLTIFKFVLKARSKCRSTRAEPNSIKFDFRATLEQRLLQTAYLRRTSSGNLVVNNLRRKYAF